MTPKQSREMVISLAFISLVPVAAINLHRDESRDFIDWSAFFLVLLAAWAHFDRGSDD